MNYVTENITPAKAAEYLMTSDGNRPISKVYVQSYADTMKAGKWLLNGVPIIFDNEGHLLDGHHRLQAVLAAGIPVRFDVCRGASTDAFTTYDCGRHRAIGQLLAMQGVKNYNLVGAIIVANDRIVKKGRLYENNGSSISWSKRNSNTERYELYRRDPEGFEETASFIKGLIQRARILTGSWAGGLCYYLTHTGGYTKEEVYPFFDALFSLETTNIPVANLLRKTLLDVAVSGKKLKSEILWIYLVKSWNSYILGNAPKILRYTPDREEKTKLILKND